MDEDIKAVLDDCREQMDKAVHHLEKELLKIRAGKANPVMLEGLRVEYYGAQTPINQVSSISAADARTLVVQPFDKSALQAIERSIVEANLGFNPQNDGSIIRIAIPMLTEERRRQLVRQAKDEGENAKISLRSVRRDANDMLKSLKEDGTSEDLIKTAEGEVQKLTNQFSDKVDEVLKKKEGEIMTV